MREHGGVKHAVGELVTCPFCLAQWVGTAFVFGYVTAPRATRLAALTMTTVAGSDVLQFVYDAIQNGGARPRRPRASTSPAPDGRRSTSVPRVSSVRGRPRGRPTCRGRAVAPILRS